MDRRAPRRIPAAPLKRSRAGTQPALPRPGLDRYTAGMKPRIGAVIFDSDGTLVDSEGPGLTVLCEQALQVGVTISPEQAQQQFLGVRMAEVVAWIQARVAEPGPDFAQRFTERARSAMAARFAQGMQAMPGARDLLEQLTLPYCVATNGPREKVEQTLRLCGLRDYFGERVFCAYEVGHFKPAPGLFLHAAQALGVPPAHCAVVEDSLAGLRAGVAAGMQVYSVLPRNAVPDELAAGIQFIDSLHALREVFR